MIGYVARCEYTRTVGHRMLERNNVASPIHFDDALEQVGVRLMPDCQEESLNRQYALFARFHIAQPQTRNFVFTQNLDHFCVPDKADLGILESALLHNLARSQRIAAVDNRHMVGVARQESGLFHSSISTPDNGHILMLKEEAIKGVTGAHTPPLQTLLARQPQPLSAGTGGDDDRACQVLARGSCNPESAFAEVNCVHSFINHLGAATARL